ncbi:hypothetical protein BDZ97DRAFT_1760880 [Flammula alnicola]|nr:hypothetical protein BDZ97DRAFT_1760880 [Flammula alnicola]
MTQDSVPPAGVSGNPVPASLREGDPITGNISGDSPTPTLSTSNTPNEVHPGAHPGDDNPVLEREDASASADSPANSRSPSPAPQDNHVTQVLAGFALLTPEQRSDVARAIRPKDKVVDILPPAAKSGRSSVLFSEEAERPSPSTTGEHKFGVHPEVIRLAECKQHIPLSLFLAESQKLLFLKPGLSREQLILNGSKVYIIKIDQFPEESKMDPTDWMEAWANYLTFLEAEASDGVFRRWLNHFKFLSSHKDLRQNFPAILLFDIEQRREYAALPTIYDEASYLRRFQEIKHAVLLDELAEWKRSLEGAVRTAPSSKRFEPFPASSDVSRGSFQNGSGSRSGGPICLICGRSGHRFSECKEDKNERGEVVACKFADKKLVSKSSASPICIPWSLGGSKRCQQRACAYLHVCSFCGIRSHFACSRSCL